MGRLETARLHALSKLDRGISQAVCTVESALDIAFGDYSREEIQARQQGKGWEERKNPDGSHLEIHRRFDVPEASRWVILPDGTPHIFLSTDVIYRYDPSGVIVERKRVKDNPIGLHVYPEGQPFHS